VVEEDGAEIDDDDSLQALDDRTLMILQPGEDWSVASGQNKQTAEQNTLDRDKSNSLLSLRLRLTVLYISMCQRASCMCNKYRIECVL